MSGSKTEEPTPRRLKEARKRGEIGKSRELVAAAGLFAGAGALALVGPAITSGLASLLERSLFAAGPAEAMAHASALGLPLLGVLAAVMLASAAAAFVQVGPLWAAKAVSFDAKRLDPIKGAKRLVSRDRFVDLARHLLVVLVAGAVAFGYAKDVAPDLARLSRAGAVAGLWVVGEALFGLALRVGGALALFAVIDLFVQKRRHRRALRMTKDEVKREHRESEGDPQHKQARARAHREAVNHATLEEVRRATVLVVNPTHYAVALRFDVDSDQEAPEVVAKGVDDLARRMIQVAREAGVPIVRDVPLARALHELELGEEIPETFYQAVAAVLEVAEREREES